MRSWDSSPGPATHLLWDIRPPMGRSENTLQAKEIRESPTELAQFNNPVRNLSCNDRMVPMDVIAFPKHFLDYQLIHPKAFSFFKRKDSR